MSEKLSKEAENILTERFGKDSVIALATIENGTPYVRYVNGFYDAGAFYVITHRLSGKMMQINSFQYYLPVNLIFGPGKTEVLGELPWMVKAERSF